MLVLSSHTQALHAAICSTPLQDLNVICIHWRPSGGLPSFTVLHMRAGCFAMGLNSSLPTPALNITAVSVSRSTGLQLVADADAGAKIALWLPRCALLLRLAFAVKDTWGCRAICRGLAL